MISKTENNLIQLLKNLGMGRDETVGTMLFLDKMKAQEKMWNWIIKQKKIHNEYPTINEISTKLGEFIKEHRKEVKVEKNKNTLNK